MENPAQTQTKKRWGR